MKIEKLTNSTYRVRKQYNGKSYTAYFDHKPTQKEVMAVISDMLQNEDVGDNKGSFEIYCNKYIESKREVLSPSTLGGYQKCKRCLSDEFKSKKLYEIEQIDVQTEISNYAKDHSPKTVKNLHGFISAVFKMFRPSFQLNTALPQNKPSKRELPLEDEVEKIIKASEGTPYHIPFQLAVLGLRRSEICALNLNDLKGNILKISKTTVYDENNHIMVRDNTKTESSTREIYLPDSLVKEIHKAGIIFDKTPPMLVKTLHKYQDELGLSRFTLHDFRHYFASYAHTQGIPDVYIMQMGGWKTDYVMKKVYRDAMKDKEKEMQERLINSLLNNPPS